MSYCTPLKRKPLVIACVSLPSTSDQIIRAALAIATEENAPLSIITVLNGQPDPSQLDIAEHYRTIANSVGASFTLLYNDNPALAVIDYIKHYHVTHVVTGTPLSPSPDGGQFLSLLHSIFPKNLTIVPVPAKSTFVADAVFTLSSPLFIGTSHSSTKK